jgi:hypothetical protein
MEQILEEELEALSASYHERTTKEILPSQTIVVGTSIFTIKMERPLWDHEVNDAY